MKATDKVPWLLRPRQYFARGMQAVLALSVTLAPVLACAQPAGGAPGASGNVFVMVCRAVLAFVAGLLLLYSLRHYWFALTRMFRPQVPLHASIETANWPRVVVLIAAHNEESVIGDCIDALLHCDYPSDRLVLMPVNDRSTDGTRAVIERYAARYPGRLHPFHRLEGAPGKAAALKDATDIVTGSGFAQLRHSNDEREAHQELLQAEETEIARVRAIKAATEYVQAQDVADLIIVFDADYLPNRQLIKQLAAPFFDPEVGAVMGRVVPQNVGVNLLTRLLDLERSAGYQVDQQARYCLGSVPQYGGTVGGVRLSALADAGGWTIDTLAEDTDLTYRLLLKGWHTAYLNHAECYEEVPQSWEVRFRQISRWAKGHNAAMVAYFGRVLRSSDLSLVQRLDGLALLGVFFMSPLLLLGWLMSAVLALAGVDFAQGLQSWELWFLMLVTTLTLAGNFAAFVQVAVASHLDGQHERIRLLPLMFFGFVVSMMAITKASVEGLLVDRLLRRKLKWDKTARFRNPEGKRGEVAP
ncbi:glycosyltransferase [Pulveribacter sp.]|uniref:glycosyltransferase family 2 protein n=1 Tax=Pulveribacter sp. TaxID=2678893 RepID=UPI0028AA8890|nr:glycosyltransferase [Pulveribacter sp.]